MTSPPRSPSPRCSHEHSRHATPSGSPSTRATPTRRTCAATSSGQSPSGSTLRSAAACGPWIETTSATSSRSTTPAAPATSCSSTIRVARRPERWHGMSSSSSISPRPPHSPRTPWRHSCGSRTTSNRLHGNGRRRSLPTVSSRATPTASSAQRTSRASVRLTDCGLTRPSGSRTGSGGGPATGRAQPYGTAPSRRSRNTGQYARSTTERRVSGHRHSNQQRPRAGRN